MHEIFCIMFSGTSLSNAAREALFQTACDCVKYEKHERKVYNDDVEGIVYTKFDFGMLGDSISGIVFEGDISTEKGESHAKFIVRLHELEKVRYNSENQWLSMDEFLEKMHEKMEAKKNSHRWN